MTRGELGGRTLLVVGCAKKSPNVEVVVSRAPHSAKFVTLKMPFHGLFLVFQCLNLVAGGSSGRAGHSYQHVEFNLASREEDFPSLTSRRMPGRELPRCQICYPENALSRAVSSVLLVSQSGGTWGAMEGNACMMETHIS